MAMAVNPALTDVNPQRVERGIVEETATTKVVASSTGWYAFALRALNEIASLPRGWDGQHSPAPDPRALGVLMLLGSLPRRNIPEPDIVPGAGGRVVMIWRRGGRRLELHFMDPSDVDDSQKSLAVLRVDESDRLQEHWIAPTALAAWPHLRWLITGQEWQ